MKRSMLSLAAVLVVSLLNLGSSCEKHGDDRYDDPDRPNRIPRYADVVREGHGKLKWTADMEGTIWVYDKDKKEIRYEGPVRRGEEVVVHPEEDRVYVAAVPVYEQNMEKHSWHKLYFISGQNYNRPR